MKPALFSPLFLILRLGSSLRTAIVGTLLAVISGPLCWAQSFRVTDTALSADRYEHSEPCPVIVTFSGHITVDGPGAVTYTFARSDGAVGPVFSLVFKSAGTQPVSTTWTLGDAHLLPTYEGWQTLKVMAPNALESSRANFSIKCQGGQSPLEEPQEEEAKLLSQLPLPKFSVDPQVKPVVAQVPGFADGTPRPVASVTDSNGIQADFIENELILMTDDGTVLDEFIRRWRGTLLATTDFSGADLESIAKWHLVRIDTSLADASLLGADLRALGSKGHGGYRVSSTSGLNLLAASANEVLRHGLSVGINWNIYGEDFLRRHTTEAGSSFPTFATWDSNAFNWPYMNSGSPQDIEVGEAWRSLSISDRLNNRIRLAVVDGGFQRMPDLPSGEIIDSPLYGDSRRDPTNHYPCSGGAPCPWHGTNVVAAGMGLVDNGQGAAGPAGPIADAVMIETPAPDIFVIANGIANAARTLASRPHIINFSGGAHIPAGLAIVPGTLIDLLTVALRANGILIFASAGNEDTDVDLRDGTFPWEATWFMPAECDGVIAVGGMAWNSPMRAAGSNFGSNFGREPGTVDIFGPFQVWIGNDPGDPSPLPGTTASKLVAGTSYSSPFVAGVAGLIWAANPSQGADTVESILMSTAHRASTPTDVPLWPHAKPAVEMALGSIPPTNFPPSIRITSPGPDAIVELNRSVTITAEATDPEDGRAVNISWSQTPEGMVRTGPSASFRFHTMERVTVTAYATDRGGATRSANIRLNVVNSPPSAHIDTPTPGTLVYRNVPVTLQGYATDRNEGATPYLDDAQLSWSSSNPRDFAPRTGHEVVVTFTTIGPRRLTLTARDTQGALDVARVDFDVIEPTGPPRPIVTITSPGPRAEFENNMVEIPLRPSITAADGGAVSVGSVIWYAEWDSDAGLQRREIGRDHLSLDWRPASSGIGCGMINLEVTISVLVIDSAGASGSASRVIILQCPPG